jgi:hypothetical protein
MKRLALLIALTSSLALATTFQKLSLQQQVEKAEVIVRATIKGTAQETRANRPWTVYTLTVRQYLRGESTGLPKRGADASIAILGGGNVRLEGAPTFKVGEDWVLLLYAQAYDSPIVGFRQGAYRLDNNRVLDVDGKVVTVEQDGKKVEATTPAFLKTLENLIGGAR